MHCRRFAKLQCGNILKTNSHITTRSGLTLHPFWWCRSCKWEHLQNDFIPLAAIKKHMFSFLTSLLLWRFFGKKHENQLWQDAETFFLPQKLHGHRIFTAYQAIYHKFFVPKGRWTIPIPMVCCGIYAPQALHVTYRLCMEPIHQSFRKLRQEMEAAGPQKASPFSRWGGGVSGKLSLEKGKRKHVWTNWGWIWRLFIFFLFIFSKSCLFVCEMGILLVFSVQTRTLGSLWFKWCYMIG